MKNDYVISAKLSADGKYLTVASLDTSMGESKTNLTLLQVGKSEPRFTVSVNGKMPYEVAFLSNDRVAFICDTVAYFYYFKGINRCAFAIVNNL